MNNGDLFANQAMAYIDAIGSMIASLADVLYKEQNGADRINSLLDSTVKFFGADRAYVIIGDAELVCAETVYERCAEGMDHQKETLKDFPPEAYRHWLQVFKNMEMVVINDMESIREVRPREYQYFKDSDVKSIIVAPFSKGGKQGFIGVDNPKHYLDQPRAMTVIAYIVGNELNEMDLLNANQALINASPMPEKEIEVKIMGDLEIRAKGGVLHADDFKQQSLMLLIVLLLKSDGRLSNEEMIAVGSLSRDSVNPESLLSTAVSRIRDVLRLIDLKDLIKQDHDGCYLNRQYQINRDTVQFLNLEKQIKVCDDPDQKMKLCYKALEMYGPLPNAVSNSITGNLELQHLNMTFQEITKTCLDILMVKQEYDEACEIIQRASLMDPKETKLLLDMARVYKATDRRGAKSYVASIKPHLSPSELKELQELYPDE